MNKKVLIIIASSVIAITLISGVVFLAVKKPRGAKPDTTEISSDTDSEADNSDDYTYIPPTKEDESTPGPTVTIPPIDEEITSFVPATEMDLDPESDTVYVNKEYALSKSYKPDKLVKPNVTFDITYYDERTLMRPEAAAALEKLFLAAESNQLHLIGVSAYRSYQRQYTIFTTNIITKGKEHTLLYSAVPGTSEHQTGLAIDVSTEGLHDKLTDEFADTPEGHWLANNAYLYGFIIRYPKDKAEITGYAYEPWHIRYVGRGLAYYLYTNDLTLDEYYHYTPSPDFDFEAVYADIINYKAPTSTAVPTVPGLVLGENGEIIDAGKDLTPTPTIPPKGDKNPAIPATPVPTPTVAPIVTEIPSDNIPVPSEGLSITPAPEETGSTDTTVSEGNGIH